MDSLTFDPSRHPVARPPGRARHRAIRVVIRDRAPHFRAAMASYLSARQHVVVGSAGAHPDAVTMVRNARPDVLVQDAGLVGVDTLRDLKRVSSSEQAARIVLLTNGQATGARSALAAGLVDVLVPRNGGLEALEEGLTSAAAAREAAASPRLQARAGGQMAESLTPKEREVLELLVAGCSTRQIAAKLGVRPSTVHTHVQGVLRKLGARSRLQAVSIHLARGSAGNSATGSDLVRVGVTEHG